MYPLHIVASTSRSSSDVEGGLVGDKTGPNALLAPTNAIRVIQLVEMPAPPRRMPPSSASASSSSASSSSSDSMMDLDAEDQEDEDCDSYCSSAADEEDDEEEALAREAEASKVGRILAWRAHLVSPTMSHHPLSPVSHHTETSSAGASPLTLSPTTPTRPTSHKRSAASSSCFSESSAPLKTFANVECTMHSGPIRVLACSDAPNRIVVAHRRNCTSTPIPCSPFADDARAQTHLAETSAALVFPFRPSFHNPCFFIRAWLLAYHPTADLHRTLSMTTSMSPRETLCPACDRAFSSVRAFRVHALHSADSDAGAACGAAVAYAMEEAARGCERGLLVCATSAYPLRPRGRGRAATNSPTLPDIATRADLRKR
ncbi:hypothetical protein B0H14DRAFT_464323 [Mycena olivaceomarginata]|nr:hypothetical protein B0H14DRAFT_464323 [Mycena olivaceomarginata]